MAAKTNKKSSLDTVLVLLILGMVCAGVLLYFVHSKLGAYNVAREQSSMAASIKEQQAVFSQKNLADLNNAFVNEEKVVAFIQTLEQAGASFTAFKLDFKNDEPAGVGDKYLTFSIDLSGSYPTIRQFVNKLLNAPWVIEIEQIELTSDNGFVTSAKGLITARMYISDKFNQ